MLRGLRRFFGFDSGEEDELEPASDALVWPAIRCIQGRREALHQGRDRRGGGPRARRSVRGRQREGRVIGGRTEADADITASTIVVGGKVRGNLSAAGRVEILPQGGS